MNGESGDILYVWMGVTGLMALALIPILIWAFRTRQFSNPERTRRLPLWSSQPEEKEQEHDDTKQE